MTQVTVSIRRDTEDPDRWWLSQFSFRGRRYTTQGQTVAEARYMAADLLAMEGADREMVLTFQLNDEATIAELLAKR